jgi:hypothetical protein
MESGTSPQPQGSPDIDNAARDAASARVHTVLPTHNAVIPEDLSDEQIITQHLVQPAVANAANDTEYLPGDDTDNLLPQSSHRTGLIIALSVILMLLATFVAVFLMIGH